MSDTKIDNNAERKADSTAPSAIPMFVFNGFGIQMSSTDISVVLLFGDKPAALIVMDPSVAKSLVKGLAETVTNYEEATQIKVDSLEELQSRMTRYISSRAEDV